MISWAKLLATLIMLEGAEPNERGASGELGILQITPAIVLDCQEYYPGAFIGWTQDDARNPVKARCLAVHWLGYWGRVYERCTGKVPSASIYGRLWNAGYVGTMEGRGKTYGQRCQNLYDK